MIITCSQCHTRFKVGDDKLVAGPIRVRCSKCNFVFMASNDPSALAQPPSSALPATMITTVPPGASFVPPSSPTPRPSAGPITGMFNAFGAPGEGPSPSGFGGATNRSGIFRAPSSDFRPPPSDPFAGLAPPSQSPVPSVPPTFAPPAPPTFPPPAFPPPAPPGFAQSAPPQPAHGSASFARSMTPGPPGATPDPFAGIGMSSPPDPFSASPTMPSAPPSPSAAVDPFAGMPTAAATPHAKDPFGLGAAPPHMFAPPAPPPDGEGMQTEGFDRVELFGAGARPSTDPFGTSPPANKAGSGNLAVDDPFATIDQAGSADSMVPTSPPAPPLPPPEEGDPFADLGIDTASPSTAAEGPDPFDRPPAKPASAPAPQPSAPQVAPRATAPAPLPPVADRAQLQRIEAAQRVRAVAWAAVQSAIFVAFVVMAVVVARGGTVDDVLRGDVAAALGGTRVAGDLAIESPRIRKRTLPSGLDVVVISGEVHNTTANPVPGARVEVRLGAEAPMSGWAWSKLDGVDVEAAATPEALVALAQRMPTSASLAPGERAPFVLVGRAPADGLAATFSVQVAAPPPSAPAAEPVPSTPAPPAPPAPR